MKQVIVILALFALVSCKGYKSLSVDEFKQVLESDPTAQLVDVRTPAEYAEGHIKGAINIDWTDKNFINYAKETLDSQRPVMVYCQKGRRSVEAAAMLQDNHYKVYNLRRGYQAWSNAGQPTDHSREIPYQLATGYFFRNDAVIDILPHKITNEIDFLSYFGMATTMGDNGKPTYINFEDSMVIPIVLPPTDKYTDIVIDALVKTAENQIQLIFHVERGAESRSYTIIPCKLLVIDSSFSNYDILISSPEKY